MKLALVAALLALSALAAAYSPEHTGEDWQSQSAADKQDTLYSQVVADTTPYGWYSTARLLELFIEDMGTTFDSVMDDMPSQALGVEERPKLIHSVGAVAECKFVSNGQHSYTGLFKGASNGFLRLSHAKAPETNPPNTVPGFGLKFLRTGVSSGNIMAMYSLTGQTSFNFFEHDFTNHAPDRDRSTLSAVNQKLFSTFGKASQWPTLLGLSDFARWDEDGNEEAEPNFPFRLVFHPSTAVHTLFPSGPQQGDTYFIDQFEQQLRPGLIYHVYAQATPLSDDVDYIGDLIATSKFSGSNYGDKDMFYQHTRMEADIALRPEWKDPMDQILADQRAVTSGYVYPDLAF